MGGTLYYRSDSRLPEQIFNEGFIPKLDYEEGWWREAVKYRGYTNDCGIRFQSIDADSSVCICMTTKLESAPMFPLNNADTYIYIIALPDSTKIEYLGWGDGSVTLLKTTQTPTELQNVVLDLHSFQTSQTRNIVNFFDNKIKNLAAYAGWSLYAYEALAYKVLPYNILGAIKCIRRNADDQPAVSCEISPIVKCSQNKKFALEGDFIQNPSFSCAQRLSVGRGADLKWEYIDYTSVKTQAIEDLKEVMQRGETATPNIFYGLGGKTS